MTGQSLRQPGKWAYLFVDSTLAQAFQAELSDLPWGSTEASGCPLPASKRPFCCATCFKSSMIRQQSTGQANKANVPRELWSKVRESAQNEHVPTALLAYFAPRVGHRDRVQTSMAAAHDSANVDDARTTSNDLESDLDHGLERIVIQLLITF